MIREISRAVEKSWHCHCFIVNLSRYAGILGILPTRALLAGGLPPDRLIVVEIDPGLVACLRTTLPGVTVLEGDARRLPEFLPEAWRGQIGSVICGVPLVLLAKPEQARFIGAINAVAPGRGFLHYSYCVTSPLPSRHHNLTARREAWTPLNLPPASVWRYTPNG